MMSRWLFRASLSLVLLALAPGCKSNCRQLSEKLCDCSINSVDRNSCLTRVSSNESNTTLTAADNERCGALLTACDCRLIDTAQGKVNCGLAWPVDAGSN